MLDIENIDWSLFKLAKSGRAIKLLYNKEPIQLCTAGLYTPFGVKSINKEWSTFTEYNIDCSLNQANTDSASVFRNTIEKLDQVINNLVKENPDIFTTTKGDRLSNNFTYTPILRENGNYPKLMKLQFTRDKNGNFDSFVFDEKKEKIMIDESNITEILTKGKIFKCIIECSKVWFYNDKIGTIWNIVQLKLSENKMTQPRITESTYTNLMIDD